MNKTELFLDRIQNLKDESIHLDRISKELVLTLSDIYDNKEADQFDSHWFLTNIFEHIIAPLQSGIPGNIDKIWINGIKTISGAKEKDFTPELLGDIVSSVGKKGSEGKYFLNEIQDRFDFFVWLAKVCQAIEEYIDLEDHQAKKNKKAA